MRHPVGDYNASLPRSGELAREEEAAFLARFRQVSGLLGREGVATPSLHLALLPSAVSYLTVVRERATSSLHPHYDFYQHPHLEEAVGVRGLLEELSCRVEELLAKFPENPVLEQVEKVKARVLAIPATAPLPHLLTGLELLLTSCHEWEKNAHRGVSLQAAITAITATLLRWRQLELAGWKHLLAAALARLRRQAAAYWLHLADTVMDARSPREEVVRTVVRYMEAATLADFSTRLESLGSVGRLLAAAGSRRASVRAALANLATYYRGLQPGVDRALEQRLKAAEAKVAEFTRMARWKDSSFWSVKAVVDKSRKTLHRSLREYQKAVAMPAKDHFVEEVVEKVEEGVKGVGEVMLEVEEKEVSVRRDVMVVSLEGREVGRLVHLTRRTAKLARSLTARVRRSEVAREVGEMLPALVAEVDKLRALAPDLSRSKEEQKKQAGFIQQRKRAAVNDLFKTLQGMGLSYRFGINNCSSVHSYRELFAHAEAGAGWARADKYFFRCCARFRQLAPLLDRALPPGVSPVLGERFLGFSLHMLHLATTWRSALAASAPHLHLLHQHLHHLDPGPWLTTSTGAEVRALVERCEDAATTCSLTLRARAREWPEAGGLARAADLLDSLALELREELAKPLTPFPEVAVRGKVARWSETLTTCLSTLPTLPSPTPLSPSVAGVSSLLSSLRTSLDAWAMRRPAELALPDDGSYRALLHSTVRRALLGIQGAHRAGAPLAAEQPVWAELMGCLVEVCGSLRAGQVLARLRRVGSVLAAAAGRQGVEELLAAAQDLAPLLSRHLALARALHAAATLSLLHYTKLLSVILKVFTEIAQQGFCPVKDMEEEDGSKTSQEFKSSEEETGLGQGEGAKDVSDQIENEDMLDGAYQNQEDAQDKEEKDNQEEDNGIEMSDNFESNLQDKKDEEAKEDEEEQEDKEAELEDETGEVEGNEDLDKDMWGEDEDEKEDKSELEDSEEKGKAEEEKMDDLGAKEDKEKSDKDEKRQRKEEEKEKENEPQEFDDNQTDEIHGEDKQMPEPEAFDLPENLELDDKEVEDNFDEAGTQEPEKMPDFEEMEEDDEEEEQKDEDGEREDTKVDDIGQSDEEEGEKLEEPVTKESEEEMDQDETAPENNAGEENRKEESGMDVDEDAAQEALEKHNDLDQDKKSKGEEGMNDESSQKNDEAKSFGVKGKDEEEEEKEEGGAGTRAEEERSLAEDTSAAERLDIVEGSGTGEESRGEAQAFRHVMDQREEDRAAVDKAEEEVQEQVLPEDWNTKKEERREKVDKMEEEKGEKEKRKKGRNGEEAKEEEEREREEVEEVEGEHVQTYDVARGGESVAVRREMEAVVVGEEVQGGALSLSLEPIHLSGEEVEEEGGELGHRLCEQLRLILEPTKAARLQGDFRTGKRLNMRKVSPSYSSSTNS